MTSTPDTLGTDSLANLESELLASRPSVWIVAHHIQQSAKEPIEVRIPPLIVRKPGEKVRNFSDDGDLFFRRPGASSWARVEVSQKKAWSRGEYPYENVIVASEHRIPYRETIDDNLERKLVALQPPWSAYFVVRMDFRAYGIVRANQYRDFAWRRSLKPQERRGRTRNWFEIPREKVSWGEFYAEDFEPLADALANITIGGF